jgi:hypothetical protein
MKKLFTSVVALTVVLAVASQAFADHKSSPHPAGMGGHGSFKGSGLHDRGNYLHQHGTKFEHGYFYKGRNHSHWTQHRFDSRYGCEVYFDPFCTSWYYWCEPAHCYYPVSYCPYRTYCWTPVVRPVVVERPVVQPVACEVAPPVVTEQVKTVRYITTDVYRTTKTQSTRVLVEEGCPRTTVGNTCQAPACTTSSPQPVPGPGPMLRPNGGPPTGGIPAPVGIREEN